MRRGSVWVRRPPVADAIRSCRLGEAEIGTGHPPLLIAGPCVIEGRDVALRHAAAIRPIASWSESDQDS